MIHKFLCSASLLFLYSQSSLAATHCTGDETVVFSCNLQHSSKTVSLCAVEQTVKGKKQPVSLAYRFGKIGSVELQYPASPAGSLSKFAYFHYFRPRVDNTSINFNNAAYAYTVEHNYEDEAMTGENNASSGLSVQAGKGKKAIEMTCADNTIQAHWTVIEGHVPCEKDDMNVCQYKP